MLTRLLSDSEFTASWKKAFTLSSLLRKKNMLDDAWEYEGLPQGVDSQVFLRRCLSWVDLFSYGISSSIGAGIFVISGQVAVEWAGPAVVLSFLMAGLVCFISALCYSEFAGRIPLSGSAYTFVYVTMGELTGWIVGWVLTVEYLMLGSAVAQASVSSWSNTLVLFDLELPAYLAQFDVGTIRLYPLAALAVLLCSIVLIMGIKTSAWFHKISTILSVGTVLFAIVVGIFCVNPKNWSPFFSEKGFYGVVIGASKLIFAYIGFDYSTALSAEVKNPGKSVPMGVLGALGVTVSLYSLSSLIITGMVPLDAMKLIINAPFVGAFINKHAKWAAMVVLVGSLVCMMNVVICSLLGQPRIYFQMAKDGLLPPSFCLLNKRKVPLVGSAVTSFFAVMLALLFNWNTISDMISCGALIAFSFINVALIGLRYNDAAAPITHTHYSLVSTIACSGILFGISGLYNWPYWTLLVCFSIFMGCVIVLSKIHPTYEREINTKVFWCPFVPALPCAGVFINLAMVAHMGKDPFLQLLVWVLIGGVVYLVYGIRHSKLNFFEPTDRFYY